MANDEIRKKSEIRKWDTGILNREMERNMRKGERRFNRETQDKDLETAEYAEHAEGEFYRR
jgi:hypothetical protein